MYNRIFSSDIADGIRLYKEREEENARLDAYVADGGQLTAPYSYFTYLLHLAIAFATGFVASLFIGAELGFICGIVSFVISFIIHWKRESIYKRYDFSAYRSSFFKRVILYTVITGAVLFIMGAIGSYAIIAAVAILLIGVITHIVNEVNVNIDFADKLKALAIVTVIVAPIALFVAAAIAG